MTVILLAALLLRVAGIDFGLPIIGNYYIRPDETLITLPAISILENFGNPDYFGYPALMMEISALFYKIGFLLLSCFGAISAPDLSTDFGSNPSKYFLISRYLSASFSAITVLLVYSLARKVSSSRSALLAAALLAMAPLACRDAHFGVTDSLVTLCGTGCIYLLASYLETGRSKILCFSAVLLGLAFSAKYSAATLFPALFFAVLLNGDLKQAVKLRHLLIIVLLPAAVFLLLNPYVIPEYGQFAAAVRMIVTALYLNKHSHLLPFYEIVKQTLTPLKYGPAGILCIPLMVASIMYVTPEGKCARIKWLIILAFVLAFLPIISLNHHMPFRYALPALPYAAIMAMLGIEAISGRFKAVPYKAVFYGFVLVALLPTFVSSVWMDLLLSRSDSRTLAGEWIRENVSKDTPIVLAGWPECEPQVAETAGSILRRIDFVRRFYGEGAVPLITNPYRKQLQSLAAARPDGYEIYRTAAPVRIPGGKICLVVPTYPYTSSALRPGGLPSLLKSYPGRITKEIHIKALYSNTVNDDHDPFDAFYLPVDHLSNIVRPGPEMNIYIISMNTEKAE